MSNLFPYILAAHIIFIVTWFAALFYIVRLFIYHTEAMDKQEPAARILSDQFIVMEKRLMQIIGTPSMVLALITGITLLSIHSDYLQQSWMHVKLLFVTCVVFYHFRCLSMMRKLARGQRVGSSQRLRLFNELATLMLVGIVFLVVLKNTLNMLYGLLGLMALALLLMMAVRWYKRSREKNGGA